MKSCKHCKGIMKVKGKYSPCVSAHLWYCTKCGREVKVFRSNTKKEV